VPCRWPSRICDTIERDTRAVCRAPEVGDKLGAQIAETVGSSAAEFAKYIADERAKWGSLIAELKLGAQ
jgi:tripartite-type tricarboxylate transporter receptor subunit TctC